MRQTPHISGVWNNIEFTLAPVRECDYVIILNRVPEDTEVFCPPENIWAIMQEPPVGEYEWLQLGYDKFSRIITPDTSLNGPRFVHDSLALPWHINKSYDELVNLERPADKPKFISWITSNKDNRRGHQQRIKFLNAMQGQLGFDLFGRGFNAIEDKFSGIYPYKYTLAVENFSGNFYWTEKLSDCFLAWSMPIYYGCTNIDAYFPKESYISIDISKPEEAAEIIKQAVNECLWEKHLDAIEYSRNLVLHNYQFFPYIANKILEDMALPHPGAKSPIELKGLPYMYPAPPAESVPRNITKKIKSALAKVGMAKW
ncbi:MAG: glycosyltransferase family 10 [Sideroxyarcus sp.]